MNGGCFWSRSLPALAGEALCPTESPALPPAMGELLTGKALVPAYHVSPNASPSQQQRQLVRVISTLAERLARLEEAYHSWDLFDPGPYFDWYPKQAEALCQWRERRGRVIVTVYADLLVPVFRSTVDKWGGQLDLARRLTRAARGLEEATSPLLALWQPSKAAFWQQWKQASEVISGVTRQLYGLGTVDFMSSHAALDERQAVATRYNGQSNRIFSRVCEVPTLTLARSFPLSPRRQPGRQQRLARHRSRERVRSLDS